MVPFADWRACLNSLAQFSPMVCRIMAAMACPSLRGGLRLHFCGRPLICSAALHAVNLFSALSLRPGTELHAKEKRGRAARHPERTGDPKEIRNTCLPPKTWH